MILALLYVVFVIGVVGYCIASQKTSYDSMARNVMGVTAIASGVFCLVLSGVIFGEQATSMGKYAEVTSFIESGIYKEYPRLLQTQIDAGVIGDISNIQTGKMLIENLQQWYDKIGVINEHIRAAQTFNSSPLFDMFWYDWPVYPPLISGEFIKELQFNISKKVENMNGVVPIINIGP